jgi:hypothetical protein
MNGHHVPWAGVTVAATWTSGLTFLSIDIEDPGLAARTCLEARLRVPFFLTKGTGSLAA